MNIVKADVEWYEKYVNEPVLRIRVDEEPGQMSWTFMELENGCTAAWGKEESGFVRFYLHNPKNQEGFGGARVVCGDRTFTGPWSSNDSYMTGLGFEPTLPVQVYTPKYENLAFTYSLVLSEYQRVLRNYVPGAMLVNNRYLAMTPQDFKWWVKEKHGLINEAVKKAEWSVKRIHEAAIDSMLDKMLKYWNIQMFGEGPIKKPVSAELSEAQNVVVNW